MKSTSEQLNKPATSEAAPSEPVWCCSMKHKGVTVTTDSDGFYVATCARCGWVGEECSTPVIARRNLSLQGCEWYS